MGPGGLQEVICELRPSVDARRLVGFELADDAGVFLLDENTALVQTVDVITPLVDDPETFGRIAAANALSDIYAMGAKPLTALNIAAFPDKLLPLKVLSLILKGSLEKCAEADCVLLGGHTIKDDEIKYGLAVTGTARPDEIVTNAGARPGDALVLTKPIGTGLISTAIKKGKAAKKAVEAAVASMTALNKAAAEAMSGYSPSACTDVTGFGLLGHATQLARASGVTITIYADKTPLLPGVKELAEKGFAPGGTKNNIKAYGKSVKLPRGFDETMLDVYFDAQTSGGLLISLPEDEAKKLAQALKRKKTPAAAVIGTVGRKRKNVDIILS